MWSQDLLCCLPNVGNCFDPRAVVVGNDLCFPSAQKRKTKKQLSKSCGKQNNVCCYYTNHVAKGERNRWLQGDNQLRDKRLRSKRRRKSSTFFLHFVIQEFEGWALMLFFFLQTGKWGGLPIMQECDPPQRRSIIESPKTQRDKSQLPLKIRGNLLSRLPQDNSIRALALGLTNGFSGARPTWWWAARAGGRSQPDQTQSSKKKRKLSNLSPAKDMSKSTPKKNLPIQKKCLKWVTWNSLSCSPQERIHMGKTKSPPSFFLPPWVITVFLFLLIAFHWGARVLPFPSAP